MTAVQYNTMSKELWQDIGAIADNENLMRRLARYAKKLVKEQNVAQSESRGSLLTMPSQSNVTESNAKPRRLLCGVLLKSATYEPCGGAW